MDNNYTHGTIERRNIVDEMKESFIDYSMSVITARALPDVRDGLKPVHRRILYSMLKTNMTPDKPHRKSAHIVGNVLANYHPHGDAAVYESMVRLAQPFSLRYTMVDGQGNFGNIDGYPAAAQRYTRNQPSSLAVFQICWSTVHPGLPLGWQPICHHTICVKSPMLLLR